MAETRWFTVDLDTLGLTEASLRDWPEEMGSVKTRMQEECLESVVALNLDVLFPDEDLLLVDRQGAMKRVADVLALDPLGCLRIMELKKKRVQPGDLEDQVISYALDNEGHSSWERLLTRNIPDLPETIETSIEGFRLNKRTKCLSKRFVADARLIASWPRRDGKIVPWEQLGRFQQWHLKADALRAARGAPLGPSATQNPAVARVIRRVYGLSIDEVDFPNPSQSFRRIIELRWRFKPAASGTEFTLIAPGLSDDNVRNMRLEQRGARFNLIDADLRCQTGRRGVSRAILRWSPVERSLSSEHLRLAIGLACRLKRDHPKMPPIQFDHNDGIQLYWLDEEDLFLAVADKDGNEVLVTEAEWLTEGRADIKQPLLDGLRKLATRMRGDSVTLYGKSGKVCVPWDRDHIASAANLAAEYFKLLHRLGFYEPYRFFLRPAGV